MYLSEEQPESVSTVAVPFHILTSDAMHECSGFSKSSPTLVILHLFFFFYSLFVFKSLWFFPLGCWWTCQAWKVAARPSCVGQVPRGPRGSRFTLLPLLRFWWCMWPLPGGTPAHPGLHTLSGRAQIKAHLCGTRWFTPCLLVHYEGVPTQKHLD